MFKILYWQIHKEALARKVVACVCREKESSRKFQHRRVGHLIHKEREWIRVLDGRIFYPKVAKTQRLPHCPNGKKDTWREDTLRLAHTRHKVIVFRLGCLELFPSHDLWVITESKCLGCRVASFCWIEHRELEYQRKGNCSVCNFLKSCTAMEINTGVQATASREQDGPPDSIFKSSQFWRAPELSEKL